MAAEGTVRHGEHNIRLAMRFAALGGGLAQHGADDLPAADKEHYRQKHQKQRRHDG
jgi:hypothetical protein